MFIIKFLFVKMLRKYFSAILLFLLVSVLVQCARRGSPTGGPKDETPPVLLEVQPKSGATHFNAKKIRFVFDELVVAKDIRKQLIISPPLENFPEISPISASRWIDVKITDTLKPNTTYVFNFGNSIQDYNEGNAFPFLKYVFSTGAFIDSLSVRGEIQDAIKPKPDNFVSVMLYPYDENYKDSLVFKQKPMYIANTLDSLKSFEINNVKEGKYMLIALKDKNNNYLFDPKEDKIGFLENPISVQNDSLFHTLTLFKQIPDFKPARPFQAADNRIVFGYEGKADSIEIKPIAPVSQDFKYIITKEPKKDSLNLWFTPKQKDSLVFTFARGQKIDTFKIRLKETKADSLKLSSKYSSTLPIGKYFGWSSNTPIVKTDSTKIRVMNKDSVFIPFKTKLEQNGLEFLLIFENQHNQEYSITALPEAITDFFGQSNDTLQQRVKTSKVEELSTLKVTINASLHFPIVMELTDEKGVNVEKQIFANKAQPEYVFSNVNPGKYKMRIIEDQNNNKQWDTGNFLKRIQPEKIIYHPKLIELRANWEVQEIFTIESSGTENPKPILDNQNGATDGR